MVPIRCIYTTMPYRRAAAPWPIEDGEYDDLELMVQAIVRAARRLDEPVRSADDIRQWRVGFEVGEFRWEIWPKRAARTCPAELREHLRSAAGRLRLAKMLTDRALGGIHPIQSVGGRCAWAHPQALRALTSSYERPSA